MSARLGGECWTDPMGQPLARSKAGWMVASSKPLHPLVLRSATDPVCAARTRPIMTAPSPPVLHASLAFCHSPGLPPRHLGRATDPIGSYRSRKCGFPAARSGVRPSPGMVPSR